MEECSWCFKKIIVCNKISEEKNIKFFENGVRFVENWGFFCCENCFNKFFEIKPEKEDK